MPKFKGEFKKLSINLKTYERELNKHLKLELFRSWEGWLESFLSIVPVWTGESVGSTLPLGRLIKHEIPINPSPTAPENRARKGAASSSITQTYKKGFASLSYQTAVEHLIVNEYIDARVFGFKLIFPGPYMFQEHGATAFLAIASKIELPSPWDYVRARSKKIG